MSQTHETFVHAVRRIAVSRLHDVPAETVAALTDAKLVYGVGSERGARGVCYYEAWHNGTSHALIEIAASAEESVIQLAGTTVHELAHILAGRSAGHSREWQAAAHKLGLRRAQAAGQHYLPADFAPDVRFAVYYLDPPRDGNPQLRTVGALPFFGLPMLTPRPCSAGIGTRGGRSRGPGSGSRLLKVTCTTCGYVARVTRKWLDVGAPICPTCRAPMSEATQ